VQLLAAVYIVKSVLQQNVSFFVILQKPKANSKCYIILSLHEKFIQCHLSFFWQNILYMAEKLNIVNQSMSSVTGILFHCLSSVYNFKVGKKTDVFFPT
jgi:hypothetical protein